MDHQFQTSFISDLVLILGAFFIPQVSAFPSGAPLSACSHLMPVHVDGQQQTSASPYILILNDTTYGSNPLKLTISAVGPGARDFMAFMLQARSEFGDPAGYFSDVPSASKPMTCYEKDDTLTHTAAFIRTFMEVIWHPPSKNIGKISITGSVAVSKIKFWAVESKALIGTGPVTRTSPGGQVKQTGNNMTSGTVGGDENIRDNRNNAAVSSLGGVSGLVVILLSLIIIRMHL